MSDATTTVTSNGSYVVGIDNNNTETDRWWSVQKDGTTELARIQEDGKMGIGNAAPIGLLHVGAGADTPVTTTGNILGYFTRLGTSAIIARDATNDSEAVMIASAGLIVLGSATNDPVVFRANNAEKMRLTAAGNLGIGVTAPTEQFVVGAGTDASDHGSTIAMVINDGAVNLAVRDATNDVEAMMFADSGGVSLGAYTNHPLFLKTANTNRLYVGTDGKVGIGVTSPGGKLHVGAGFDSPSTSSPTLYVTESGQVKAAFRDGTNDIEAAIIVGTSLAQLGTITNHDLVLLANNAEAARVKADGKVGIGTTAPSVRFEVATDGGGNVIASAAYGTGAQASLNLMTARGTLASPTATQNADYLGEINFQGWDTDRSTGTKILALAAANWGTGADSTDAPANLYFQTVPDGSGTLADRMVLWSDGKINMLASTYKSSSARVFIGDADPFALNSGGTDYYYPLWPNATLAAPQGYATVLVIENGPAGLSVVDAADDKEIALYANGDGIGIVANDAINVAVAGTPYFRFTGLRAATTGIFTVTSDLDTPLDNTFGPTAMEIQGQQKRLYFFTDAGEVAGYLGVDRVLVPQGRDYLLEHWDGDTALTIMRTTVDYRCGLHLIDATHNPEGALHVIHRNAAASKLGGYIFTADQIDDNNVHDVLSGVLGWSYVGFHFTGTVIVRNWTGSNAVSAQLDLGLGGTQAVTSATGKTLTFSISSNKLQVQRTAGSDTMYYTLQGIWD